MKNKQKLSDDSFEESLPSQENIKRRGWFLFCLNYALYLLINSGVECL